MNRNEAIAYLTRCADDSGVHWSGGRQYDAQDCPTCKGTNDAGWLYCPGSHYGRTSAEVAPIAYRHAKLWARQGGWELTTDLLNQSMSLAVNDHPDIAANIAEYAAELAGADIDAMAEGYIGCQLWAQPDWNHNNSDDNPPSLDRNYERSDVSDDYVESVRELFSEIVTAHPLAVRMYIHAQDFPQRNHGFDPNELFGHDFYLTREHHGAGFWDRGLGELGRYLTDIAHAYGAADDLSDNGEGELTA